MAGVEANRGKQDHVPVLLEESSVLIQIMEQLAVMDLEAQVVRVAAEVAEALVVLEAPVHLIVRVQAVQAVQTRVMSQLKMAMVSLLVELQSVDGIVQRVLVELAPVVVIEDL
jgi:hypothetical protein